MGRDWAAAVWGSFIPIPWQRRPFHRYSRRASNTSQLCIDSWRYEPDRDARRTLTIPEEHSILVPHGPGSAKAREEAEWHLARLASSRVRDICVGGLYSSSDQGGGLRSRCIAGFDALHAVSQSSLPPPSSRQCLSNADAPSTRHDRRHDDHHHHHNSAPPRFTHQHRFHHLTSTQRGIRNRGQEAIKEQC